jgi:hypothetical protein
MPIIFHLSSHLYIFLLLHSFNNPRYRSTRSFLFINGAEVEPWALLQRPFIGLLYQPWMIGGDDCGDSSGMNERQGKPKHSEKTCPSATLSITDPT